MDEQNQPGLTLEQAKSLPRGTILYHRNNRNADGSPQRWKVNGFPKTWKRSPHRVQVPLKHGLYTYDYLTEDTLHLVELDEDKALEDDDETTRARIADKRARARRRWTPDLPDLPLPSPQERQAERDATRAALDRMDADRLARLVAQTIELAREHERAIAAAQADPCDACFDDCNGCKHQT